MHYSTPVTSAVFNFIICLIVAAAEYRRVHPDVCDAGGQPREPAGAHLTVHPVPAHAAPAPVPGVARLPLPLPLPRGH